MIKIIIGGINFIFELIEDKFRKMVFISSKLQRIPVP